MTNSDNNLLLLKYKLCYLKLNLLLCNKKKDLQNKFEKGVGYINHFQIHNPIWQLPKIVSRHFS